MLQDCQQLYLVMSVSLVLHRPQDWINSRSNESGALQLYTNTGVYIQFGGLWVYQLTAL